MNLNQFSHLSSTASVSCVLIPVEEVLVLGDGHEVRPHTHTHRLNLLQKEREWGLSTSSS